MAKTVSLTSLSAKEMQTLKELIKQDVIKSPTVATYAKIFPNIPYTTTMNFHEGFGLVGVADTGCSAATDTATLGLSSVTFTPKPWIADIKECYTDYNATLIEPQMNVLMDRSNLVDTELIDFLAAEYVPALENAIHRFAWFNDTAAKLVSASPAGVITAGTEIKYFTVYNGFFKQLYTICTNDPTKRVTIAANAEATFALQDSALTPTLAYGYFLEATYNCDLTVKANKIGYKILATQELYDKACQYLQANNTLVNAFIYLENGVQVLKVNGYVVEPMSKWSEHIRAYESNGTKYHDPHRFVLLNPNNFGIAVPKSDIVMNVETYYDWVTRLNYMRAQGVMDMQILVSKQVMFGY